MSLPVESDVHICPYRALIVAVVGLLHDLLETGVDTQAPEIPLLANKWLVAVADEA